MNDNPGTAAALVDAGRELFSTHGYDGTSIRALTSLAGVNLGAVTYHFGSKEALYEAVAVSVMSPLRDVFARVAGLPTTPLERLEELVREALRYLQDHPELPRLMLQQLASDRPIPPVVAGILRDNMAAVAGVIAEGQRAGAIRDGDPRLMALSIVAQPIWISAARRVLLEAFEVDQGDERIRADLADSVARSVHGGVMRHSQETV